MTREELKTWFSEKANITVADEVVDEFMKMVNKETNKLAEARVSEAIETAKKSYEGYVKPADYEALKTQYDTLVTENAKQGRIAKLKARGVNEKLVDYFDSQIKDAEDVDQAIETIVQANPEFFNLGSNVSITPQAKADITIGTVGGGQPAQVSPNQAINSFIRGDK